MAKFPRGHAANKKLIASCAANGVAIEGLEGASRFRFYPVERARDSFKGRDDGGPSGRGSVLCGRAKPKHIKNWNPARTSLDPQYEIAMAGDDRALTKARRAYAQGDPDPLRKYLAEQAAARRAPAAPEPMEAYQYDWPMAA